MGWTYNDTNLHELPRRPPSISNSMATAMYCPPMWNPCNDRAG